MSVHFQWIATLEAYLRAGFGWFEKDTPSLRPSGLLMRMGELREIEPSALPLINGRAVLNAPPTTLAKCAQM